MSVKTNVFFVCLIAMIGAAALIVNGIFPNNTHALVGAVILCASGALYAALLTEVATANIVNAIVEKNLENQTSLLASVIGKSVYKVIKEEESNNKEE
jgi:hypothetical protein